MLPHKNLNALPMPRVQEPERMRTLPLGALREAPCKLPLGQAHLRKALRIDRLPNCAEQLRIFRERRNVRMRVFDRFRCPE